MSVTPMTIPTPDPDSSRRPAHRFRPSGARAVQLAIGALVVTVLTVEFVLVAPSVLAVAGSLTQSSLAWLAVAAVATVASMVAFARVRQRMLSAAGVRVPLASSVAVSYAAGALNTTMPGGGVVSTAYTFRRIRGWGAPTAIATWCVAVTGLLATATLSVVGATGIILGGGTTGSFLQSAVEVTAVLLSMAGIAYLTSNPDRLAAPAGAVLRRANHLRGRPAQTGYARLSRLIDDLRVIRPSRRSWIDAWVLSLLNWVLDAACLAACCAAFGVQVSLPALLITYTAAMAATSLTPVPGGLGVVEAALMLGLTAAGAPWKAALAAVVVYRLLSVGSVALVGWGLIGARRLTRPAAAVEWVDPAMDAAPVLSPAGIPSRRRPGGVPAVDASAGVSADDTTAGVSAGVSADDTTAGVSADAVPDAAQASVALPQPPDEDPEPDATVPRRVETAENAQTADPRRAREVMTIEANSVAPGDSWQRVARNMRRFQASAVPVCDEHGELRGIIDYRDIGLRCLAAGGSAATAASLAQEPAVTIGLDDPVEDVAQLMAQRRAWLAPVLDGRRLIGVIHYADIVSGAPHPLVGSPPPDVERTAGSRPQVGAPGRISSAA